MAATKTVKKILDSVTIDAEITDLQANVASLTANLATLNTALSSAANLVANLTSWQTGLIASMTSANLVARVGVLEACVANIQAEIG